MGKCTLVEWVNLVAAGIAFVAIFVVVIILAIFVLAPLQRWASMWRLLFDSMTIRSVNKESRK